MARACITCGAGGTPREFFAEAEPGISYIASSGQAGFGASGSQRPCSECWPKVSIRKSCERPC